MPAPPVPFPRVAPFPADPPDSAASTFRAPAVIFACVGRDSLYRYPP